MRLVIASRKSDLARIQAYTVGQELQKKNPNLQIEYYFRESLGDINSQDPLWKMPEKGVFTEDFHRGLVSGEWDMVVHSWKDLPILEREGTHIAATLPREDVRDLLLVKKSYDIQVQGLFLDRTLKGSDSKGRSSKYRSAASPPQEAELAFERPIQKQSLNLNKTFRVLTSSPRREYNLQRSLKSLLPWGIEELKFESVRGNIPTRIRKLLEGDAHGLVVAKAALDRILSTDTTFIDPKIAAEFAPVREEIRRALKELRWMVLPIQLNPPAAAQGALAVEIKHDRKDLKQLLQSIHCQDTFVTVECERQMLQAWGGGCHQKIGVSVLKKSYGTITVAQGKTDDGSQINIFELASQRKWTITKNSYFPHSPQEGLWFERKPLQISEEWKSCTAHYVSKTEALPEQVALKDQNHLVWTSGLKTWQKLATRGIWVNGSSESLGEDEDFRIEALDSQDRNWCKWTHSSGEGSTSQIVVASYGLYPLSQPPKLSPQTENFFWMSGSSFEQALTVYPWLVDKIHWSGPGHTHTRIQKIIQEKRGKGAAEIALSFDQWQKMMT